MAAVAAPQATAAERLSEHLAGLSYKNLPADVVAKAKEAMLDHLGCQLIGSTLEWNNVIYNFVKDQPSVPESSIVNRPIKTAARDAAFVNATFGQGCEYDDILRQDGFVSGHPGAMTFPVALALGEKLRSSGEEVITAVVAGYETAFRLGKAMFDTRARGWHNQGVIGVFAATATASKMLGLDADTMAQAFTLAGSQAGATTEYDVSGGEVKRMHAGLSVRGGIESALLAKGGLTGPLTIFEGKRSGILQVFCGHNDPTPIFAGLGKDFGIRYVAYKVVCVPGNIQSPIHVFGRLVDKHRFSADEIARIDVGLIERAIQHGGSITEPKDACGAQFSLAFSLGIRVVKGGNELPLYQDEKNWFDPSVLRIARAVNLHVDDRFHGNHDRGSHVKVTLKDGRTFEGEEIYPKGDPHNPLSTEEREEKFRKLASAAFPKPRVQQIIDQVNRVETLSDIGSLVALLRSQA